MPLVRRISRPNHRYHALIFIGRFQPFHLGHKQVVDRALELAAHVIVLVGSANASVSVRNPFSFEQRHEMISSVYGDHIESGRLTIKPLDDIIYNDTAWVENTQETVRAALDSLGGFAVGKTLRSIGGSEIGIIGCSKDHTSYYLKLFPKPTWGNESVEFFDNINATDIRKAMMSSDFLPNAKVPAQVLDWLLEFRKTKQFQKIADEHEFAEKYKNQFKSWPYPGGPTHVTADAVVVQSGQILLVRRKAKPGEGMMALPGGFLNPSETLQQCVLRELKEETKIDVPDRVLRGCVAGSRLFDEPTRSSRGRVITHAFLIKLEDRPEMPKVKGGDDAASAFWVPLADLDPRQLFEDHWHIIKAMTASL